MRISAPGSSVCPRAPAIACSRRPTCSCRTSRRARRIASARRLRRFALPPSPTNVYAVSVQGAGEYRLKLAFQ